MRDKYKNCGLIYQADITDKYDGDVDPVVTDIVSIKQVTFGELRDIILETYRYSKSSRIVYANVGQRAVKVTIKDNAYLTPEDYAIMATAIWEAWGLHIQEELQTSLIDLLANILDDSGEVDK